MQCGNIIWIFALADKFCQLTLKLKFSLIIFWPILNFYWKCNESSPYYYHVHLTLTTFFSCKNYALVNMFCGVIQYSYLLEVSSLKVVMHKLFGGVCCSKYGSMWNWKICLLPPHSITSIPYHHRSWEQMVRCQAVYPVVIQ